MRATNLAQIAAEAEILRIKRMLIRQGLRAALGLVAAVFLIAVLTLASIIAWQLLGLKFPPIVATLIMVGANLLLAIILGWIAARSSPNRTEREALDIRKRATGEARNSLTLPALIPVPGAKSRSRQPANHEVLSREDGAD
jgi:hypothetical protein